MNFGEYPRKKSSITNSSDKFPTERRASRQIIQVVFFHSTDKFEREKNV